MASERPVITVEVGKNTEKGKAVVSRWWTLEGDELATNLFALVRDIENKQQYRKVRNLRHARLYSNMELLALQPGMFYRTPSDLLVNHRVTLNVIKSIIDTVCSKISKAKPRPIFLTDGGDWEMQERAKRLTKYMDGVIQEMDLYQNQQRSFLYACVFGLGATKFFIEDNKVKCEWVFTDELIVDDAEGIYGKPQQVHQSKWINRDVLLDMFKDDPEKVRAIKENTDGVPGTYLGAAAKDLIRVIESWHLPSGKGAKDGRHAISISNCTLLEEEYTKPYFPFVFHRWSDGILGFYGMGIAEEILGIQLELNKLLRTTQEAMHLMAVPRIFMDVTSKVASPQLSNKVGSIVKFSGNPPIFNTAPAMPPEVYQHILFLWGKAYEQVGVSQMSAASRKPAGLNSGVALREFQDTETERFELVAKRYEETFLQAAEIIVDLTKDIAASGHDPMVLVKAGKKTEAIAWADVDMERDKFVMRIFPTSLLPTQPAAKLQTVTELTQAGFIQKDQAMDLLDFPDIEEFQSLANAAVHDIKRMVGVMLEKGEPQIPEPFMNLGLAVQMTQSAYLKARYEGYPEERLQLLRDFMDNCKQLIEAMQPPPAAGPNPMTAGAPTAVPGQSPVSDMMPLPGAGGPA